MERNTKGLCQIQARITAAKDREQAWAIIQDAPEAMRDRLTKHAQTVFAIRRYYESKGKNK